MIWWILLAASVVVLIVTQRLKKVVRGIEAQQNVATKTHRRPLVVASSIGSNAATTPPPRPQAPPAAAGPQVEEAISVVLRRQIPVRFEEPPRSWLGGLPMMPEDAEWPTTTLTDHPERGRVPMNFAAQIACADLPAELWGGLGPRDGWLLLFLSGASWEGDKEDAAKVIHIPELGPERAPPPGIFPVHDLGYTGPDYSFVRGQADVPTTWRRWPVDLVTVPNKLLDSETRRPSIIPDGFASLLYDGAPVASDSRIRAPEGPPFSWRGALYVVDSIACTLNENRAETMRDESARLSAPEWIGETLQKIADERAKWVEAEERLTKDGPPSDPAELAKYRRLSEGRLKRIANLDETATFLREDGPLWDRLKQSHEQYVNWRAVGRNKVAEVREQIAKHELDEPLLEADWKELQGKLAAHSIEYWSYGYRDLRDGAPYRSDKSLLDFAKAGLEAARSEIGADYYAASAVLKALVPADVIAALEPQWRQVYNDRPHRMGGMHDGVQSDPDPVPTEDILLFQIATDYGMHWCWGDAGAYFVFIKTSDLARGNFAAARAQLECH
jgi:uncharacterized protein YwqG